MPSSDDVDNSQDEPSLIRPYVISGGRTDSGRPGLGVESIVEAIGGAPPSRLSSEEAQIITLCEQPMSVAEVSSHLRLPIGVTRVLVSDLVEAGRLRANDATGADDTLFVRKLIEGIRAL